MMLFLCRVSCKYYSRDFHNWKRKVMLEKVVGPHILLWVDAKNRQT